MDCRPLPSAWDDLLRTASTVRAADEFTPTPPSDRRHLRRALRPIAISAALGAACGLAVLHLAGSTGTVRASASEDSQLFRYTNQDRTSNGVHSLTYSGTLQNIGEGAPYNCNGVHIFGRSVDMIRRNYFAHPILGCGQLVFSMMQAYGVGYRSAGENIGWEAYSSSPAFDINVAFMNSPEHKANILASRYTEMGVGSDESAPGVNWTGVGSYQNVWMFSEEFAQVGSSPPPPPRGPAPKPVHRNSPAPPPPRIPPAVTTPLTTAPTPTPLPIPIGSFPEGLAGPPVSQYEGLLPNTIESVLEAFLTF